MPNLLFLLSLFVNTDAFSCEDVDLSYLWAGHKKEDQGRIGSCHAFATVNAVEAKLMLDHSGIFELSHADLFQSRYRLKVSPEAITQMIVGKKGYSASEPNEVEGDFTFLDFTYIRGNGICRKETYEKAFGTYDELENKVCVFRNQEYPCLFPSQDIEISNPEKMVPEVENKLKESSNWTSIQEKRVDQKVEDERTTIRELIQNYYYQEVSLKDSALTSFLLKYCGPITLSLKNYNQLLNPKAAASNDKHAVVLAGVNCIEKKYLIKNSWGIPIDEVSMPELHARLSSSAYLDDSTASCLTAISANDWMAFLNGSLGDVTFALSHWAKLSREARARILPKILEQTSIRPFHIVQQWQHFTSEEQSLIRASLFADPKRYEGFLHANLLGNQLLDEKFKFTPEELDKLVTLAKRDESESRGAVLFYLKRYIFEMYKSEKNILQKYADFVLSSMTELTSGPDFPDLAKSVISSGLYPTLFHAGRYPMTPENKMIVAMYNYVIVHENIRLRHKELSAVCALSQLTTTSSPGLLQEYLTHYRRRTLPKSCVSILKNSSF